ncbi:MAG: hypothetical protein JWP11_3231 [Frankiales bacterium]|nr:hypothetical protein [Frankiales bacterium]
MGTNQRKHRKAAGPTRPRRPDPWAQGSGRGYGPDGVWHEHAFGDGWRVAVRMQWQRGRLVTTEARVFPDPFADAVARTATGAGFLAGREQSDDVGGWGAWLAQTEIVDAAPDGGITTAVLRQIPLAVLAQQVREAAPRHAEALASLGYVDSDWSDAVDQVAKNPRPGRTGRSDKFYAQMASEYTARVAVGNRRPVEDMATQMRYSRSTVEGWIKAARKRELLTPARPGQPGGDLTDKARALLAGSDINEQE